MGEGFWVINYKGFVWEKIARTLGLVFQQLFSVWKGPIILAYFVVMLGSTCSLQLKGCVQEARKWLFRPNFFSSSKWAQLLHVTLDLTGKRCPVIFSAVLFFVFEKFSSTSTGGKCALRRFYCLEKQKLSLERTPPGKKLRFCIRYLWKMKEKPANLNKGVCFSIKWKATCRTWAHLDEEKQFGLKSHLRACCTQPFNWLHSGETRASLTWGNKTFSFIYSMSMLLTVVSQNISPIQASCPRPLS